MWADARRRVAMGIAALALACWGGRSGAVDREVVLFQSDEVPQASQRLSIVGDLLELGAGDLERSVDLVPDGASGSHVLISLPVNSVFTYERYLRARSGCTAGKGAVLAKVSGSTATRTDAILSKTLYLHSQMPAPVCHWRIGREPFHEQAMVAAGEGRSPEETRWMAAGLGPAGGQVELYIADANGGPRVPADGTYRMLLDVGLLQDGEVFGYLPAPQVSAGRLTSERNVESAHLGQVRRYQVFLPRGYDEHPERRYPVVYLHDGAEYFYQGDVGQVTLKRTVREGRSAECIVVGINAIWATRNSDLIPPEDNVDGTNGRGDEYTLFILDEVKPLIDAEYRTLPDAEHTATAGFSFGGLIAAYQGWEFNDHFRRAGSHSGSFWVPLWVSEARNEPMPRLRLYLDSGDVDDNYDVTLLFRDDLLVRAENPAVLEGNLRYVHACGQNHTFQNAATRLDEMFEFLFPATEEPPGLPVPPSPMARFLVAGDCSRSGTEICLDASPSLTPDGTKLTRFSWDFGDGGVGEGATACHAFESPGERWVSLEVENDADLRARYSGAVCVGCWGSEVVGPWTPEDIGAPAFPGGTRASTADDGSTFEVCAGGRPLAGTTDSIRFVHGELAGDGVVTLHATQVSAGTALWQVGVMMRGSNDPGAPFAAMSLKSSSLLAPRLSAAVRPAGGRPVTSRTAVLTGLDGTEFWVRLERRGSEFRGQGSVDGLVWSDPLTVTAELPPAIHVGLFACGNETPDTVTGTAIAQARIASIEVVPLVDPEPRFSRGDANGDGQLDLSDPVFVLGYQFLGGPAPGCLDAADSNDSGEVDISDAIHALGFLFLGGPAPPPPFPECGADPTPEAAAVGCEVAPESCR